MENSLIQSNKDTIIYNVIKSKIESREFGSKSVDQNLKKQILDAARLTGSGMNAQHWRFVLVQEKQNIERLAKDSTTGGWVSNADFAVIVLTDPQYAFHMIDAGRAIQSMMLAAWGFNIASGIYVGINAKAMYEDFNLPKNMNISAVLGFGYPKKRIIGKKDRKPLSEVAYLEKYGRPIEF